MHVRIPKASLVASLRWAGGAADADRRVKFFFRQSSLSLASSHETEESDRTIEIERVKWNFPEQCFQFVLNLKYVQEAIAPVKGDMVELRCEGPLDPVHVIEEEREGEELMWGYRSVIAPMKS